ncbi:hypothetical protein EDD18DRAFT_1108878 [Armillaria luteobubalina]|uniref:Uncharacterized protein n=1 Tax=Armillaria luteobubalina TaxID=153913 RepID=A0AA39TK40_9AGAR|nr:hypothetical protein EDD18DRAFT_1108878 [Armillaria luteobubalina]
MSSNQVSRHQIPTLWITSALWLRSVVGLDSFADIENTDRSLVLFVKVVSANIFDGTMVAEWTVENDICRGSNCTEIDIFFDTHNNPSLSDSRYGDGSDDRNKLTVQHIFKSNPNATGTGRKEDPPNFRTKLNLSTSGNYQDYYSGRSSQSSPTYYLFDRDHRFAIVFSGRTRREDTNQIFDMVLSLRCSTLVIVYCLVITVTLWLVTLMICFIMIATVIFRFRQRNEIVIVPIGSVFTFTQLRSTMPGAPGDFGSDNNSTSRTYRWTFTWNELGMIDPRLDQMRLSEYTENELLHYAKRMWSTSKEFIQRAGFDIRTVMRRWRRILHRVEIPLVNTTSRTSS